jgi:hypothetical protein
MSEQVPMASKRLSISAVLFAKGDQQPSHPSSGSEYEVRYKLEYQDR